MRLQCLAALLLALACAPLLPAQDAPPATMARPRTRAMQFGGPSPGAPSAALATGPACSLDATIYDLRIPADKTATLNADALAKAADSPENFEKALAALGTAKPLYRTHQSVRLGGDSIVIGNQTPVVTNTRTTDSGQKINSVTYRQTGAIFHIKGSSSSPTSLDLDLRIETSSLTEGQTEIAPNVTAPITRTAQLAQKGPTTPNTPIILFSIDAASPDTDGNAVVTLARLTLGPPAQPPATAPAP